MVSPVSGKTIAMVGDRAITDSELDRALENYKPKGSFHNIMSPEERERFRSDALRDIIEEELLFREAKLRGIKVEKDIIEKVIEANIKRLGSKKAFNEALKREGIDLKQFKERVKRRQMVLAVLKGIATDSEVKDEELKDYYEKNKNRFKRPESMHLYHIYIKVEPSATDEEWKKKMIEAEEILKKIRDGEDFGTLAGKYSQDDYRIKNGDMGVVHRGQLNPVELEDAAFSLKEGEVSGVIKTIYGFHILKAGKKTGEEILSYDQVKERLKREFTEKRFEEKKKELLDRLKKQFTVIIYETGKGD